MSDRGRQESSIDGGHGNRVSSAVWPLSVRKIVATGKAAQRRRDWIMQGRWWVVLAGALVMRGLFIAAMVLVVVTSLLVALLGLSFWYLLLLPLVFFASLLVAPAFIARRVPAQAVSPTLATFAQECKSSAGIFSLAAQNLKYQSHLLSRPGILEDESPSTPMPVEPPLVRVLETYDLRATHVEHFLREETDEHITVPAAARDLLRYMRGEEVPETGRLACAPGGRLVWGQDESDGENSGQGAQNGQLSDEDSKKL